MPILSDDKAAFGRLVETLRHQPHGNVKKINTVSALFFRQQPRSNAHQVQIEQEIGAVFEQFCPKHHVHNTQKGYALTKIAASGIAALDPAKDSAAIDAVLDDIHAKRAMVALQSRHPVIAQPVDPYELSKLNKPLEDYGKLTLSNTAEFAHVELMGFRSDRNPAKTQDFTHIKGQARDHDRQKANLATINATLDRIVPASPYYNEPRQMIIDTIIKHGDILAKWISKEQAITASQANNRRQQHIPNEFHHGKQRATAGIDTVLQAMAVDQAENTGYSRRLTPQAAVKIGRLMQSHRELAEGYGRADDAPSFSAPPAKRRKLNAPQSFHVPQAIRNAVMAPEPVHATTRPQAAHLAAQIAQTVNQIVPPRRGNFQSRLHFMTSIAQNRDAFQTSLSEQPSKSNVALDQLRQSYRQAFDEKRPLITKLAQQLNDYQTAWRDKTPLSAAPVQATANPAPIVSEVAASMFAHKAPPKVYQSKIVKDLQKASAAEGQGKLDMAMFRKPKAATAAKVAAHLTATQAASQAQPSPLRKMDERVRDKTLQR